jgi:hypothetical protein
MAYSWKSSGIAVPLNDSRLKDGKQSLLTSKTEAKT